MRVQRAIIAAFVLALPDAHSADVLLVVDPFDDVINRYDGTSGAFLGQFASVRSITVGATEIKEGPNDGLIYLGNGISNDVLRLDAASGTLIDTFIAPGSGGLANSSSPRIVIRLG